MNSNLDIVSLSQDSADSQTYLSNHLDDISTHIFIGISKLNMEAIDGI